MSFRFKRLGEVVHFRNQRYEVCGFELYKSATGKVMEVVTFATHCAVCGTPMTVFIDNEAEVLSLSRRCATHKNPGRRVPLSQVHPNARGRFA